MNIYILADMEGISGISNIRQVKKEFPDYEEGRKLLMAEINCAVAACFDGGAKTVVVGDTHGGGGHILLSEMDSRGIYETPVPGRMMPSLDRTFDGLILLGHHAMAGVQNAFLDHTMNSRAWFDFRLNGKSMGEIGIEATYAGYFGVPVVAATGDEAAAREAESELPQVETAVVKWGLGRNSAKCLSVKDGHAEVEKAIRRALSSIGSIKPYKPQMPATIELTFYRSDIADNCAVERNVVRVDARTVRTKIKNASEIRRVLLLTGPTDW
jgi:D-amino peptidase